MRLSKKILKLMNEIVELDRMATIANQNGEWLTSKQALDEIERSDSELRKLLKEVDKLEGYE